MMVTETQTISMPHSTPIQKFSRYQSVRQGTAKQETPPPATQALSNSQNESIQRSMSRYRKRSIKSDHISSPSRPQQTGRPARVPQAHLASLAALTGEPYPNDQELLISPPRKNAGSRPRKCSSPKDVLSPAKITTSPSTPPVRDLLPLVEHQRQEQAGQDMNQRQEGQRQSINENETAANKESPGLARGNSVRQKLDFSNRAKAAELRGADRIQRLAERKDLSGCRRAKETIMRSTPDPDIPTNKPVTASNILPAAWVDAPVSRPLAQQSAQIGPAQWVDAPVSRPVPQNETPVLVPQYDAPVSAVNAGERHVRVNCNEDSINLPVMPTTTPEDLMDSASKAMSGSIDPTRSKLVESFTQLGLERPLRNYEHIRDVMNSWDHDTQNTFVILPAEKDEEFDLLDSTNAPKRQPGDTSFYMYHSQRPGTWEKRWITLRSDGQMTVSKRPGQETSNICHLTDFDIYVPTHRQQTRRIRPPKKVCFAVKSQQKSSMFLNGANFVHFFATNDKVVAREWYKAVQGWRSWYLVNVLGEGQKSKRASTNHDSVRSTTSRSQRRGSINATAYQLGSFQPLLDFDRVDLNFSDPNSSPRATKSAEAFHARKMSNRDKAPPPTAFPNNFSNDVESVSPATPATPATYHHRTQSFVKGPTHDETEEATFAPTGLLGRTYSQKQKAQREREKNGGRSDSIKSIKPPTGLSYKPSMKSVRQMPKPLIDLTPQFQEPLQHAKKGRGVRAKRGQQLVEAATGLEIQPGAIITPSATAWRRPQAPLASPENIGRPRRLSMDAAKPSIPIDGGRRRPSMDAGRPQMRENEPFIDGGLLARTLSKHAQGGSGTGHGVRTGNRNATGKPMIDLQMTSRFADGSLLKQVEAQTGSDRPIIDREKRPEENVRIGDGVMKELGVCH